MSKSFSSVVLFAGIYIIKRTMLYRTALLLTHIDHYENEFLVWEFHMTQQIPYVPEDSTHFLSFSINPGLSENFYHELRFFLKQRNVKIEKIERESRFVTLFQVLP